MNLIKVKLFKIFVIIVIVINLSCTIDYSKELPGNIEIPGYGSLNYSTTILEGSDIYQLEVEDGFLWGNNNNSKIVRYNTQTSETEYISLNRDVNNISSKLMISENKVIFIVELYETGNESNPYRLAVLDKNSFNIVYITFNINENVDSNSELILSQDGSRIYLVNSFTNYYESLDFGLTWSSINSIPNYEPFSDLNNYFRDDIGNLYKISNNSSIAGTSTELQVSIDELNNIYSCNLGSCEGEDVVVSNNVVYVSASGYSSATEFTHGNKINNGILVFNWNLE